MKCMFNMVRYCLARAGLNKSIEQNRNGHSVVLLTYL